MPWSCHALKLNHFMRFIINLSGACWEHCRFIFSLTSVYFQLFCKISTISSKVVILSQKISFRSMKVLGNKIFKKDPFKIFERSLFCPWGSWGMLAQILKRYGQGSLKILMIKSLQILAEILPSLDKDPCRYWSNPWRS